MTETRAAPIHDDWLDRLRAAITPLDPRDSMSEAVRKALLVELVRMLEHQPGSAAGDDIENIHDMRVATRRIRSTLRLLGGYFKAKQIAPFQRQLRRVGRALGSVRDLDVLIEQLSAYRTGRDDEVRDGLQEVINVLHARRVTARQKLAALLEKKAYRTFVNALSAFVTTPGAGARPVNGRPGVPVEVRHVLPVELYSALGVIRAYDSRIAGADVALLHALRIEFKRLRYLMSIFGDLLGKPGREFIDELKVIQDHLGRLNDVAGARTLLSKLLPELDHRERDALGVYLADLESEEQALRDQFPDLWQRFNSKSLQRHLANGIAGL